MIRSGIVVAGLLFSGVLLAMPVAAQLVDPTRPADYFSGASQIVAPRARAEWILTAIRISPDERIAILNKQVVREGDSIAGNELVEITPVHVVLQGREGRIIVLLYQQVVKSVTDKNKNGERKQ